MAESSADKWEYETKVAKRFGFEQQLELPIPMPTSAMGQVAANRGGLLCPFAFVIQPQRCQASLA